ncbi:initiation factor eif-2b delta subunit, putative [Entamoeba histolytica HM-1:IMSS-B]|uniref:Translation initiation factor eIF2B subunit delta n=4 Tax=Entamoeba histolytica TaxID=5759 RepID=C4M666_ENTH1|nr:Initiation factor eIF-2B delta subunit, putative [Entamoeba histolytica HM-1:IMSS]EAL47236.1 Initiation factor eIF-2B delta subunit, putative [Entamoeba histolytica HM-1:IMSS]EMD43703.1 translation initiation factor 2B delta subunit, putative [Entamoeba histolytica KU27]EMH73805.1 initiation factor eif-2b delta subunit, putative [Entamoeba histolytica HM-1:IMSS-B]ENY60737.1 translation initiation factor 2B, delta subunit, putative [Entamoeba histolytica HM-1:IMSS-A]|eukprot:XP_652622.1 Initiation factor eIF-2B delta subunit, putative [Entamoeba histolytica HM-1:IMSS]
MASILYTLNFVICIILIVTLTLLLIPIPNILKKQILSLSHWIVKKRIFSITLLVIVSILFIDAFSRMKHCEGVKQSLAFDAPINTRISTYSETNILLFMSTKQPSQLISKQNVQGKTKQQQTKGGKDEKQKQGKTKEEKKEGQLKGDGIPQLSNKELKALKKQQKHDKKAAKLGENNQQLKTGESQVIQQVNTIELMLGTKKQMPIVEINSTIHPSFARFALECSEYKCVGSTIRALRFIECIIQTLKASKLTQSSECIPLIEENVKLLEHARTITVGMNNVRKFIFMKNQSIENIIATAQTVSSNIIGSQKEIVSSKINEKIVVDSYKYVNDGSVILTINYSTLLLNVFKTAFTDTNKFRVIVVETSPFEEGAIFARALSEIGIDTTYILPSGLQVVLASVNRVILSASSMDGRGSLYTRSGTASVLIAAKSKHIPVIVCCETYKMTDEIMKNEGEICRIGNGITLYDEIPHDFITVVVTEFGCIPATSIPAVVRELRWDSKALSQEKY